MEPISIYATVGDNGRSAGPALAVIYKLDAPYAEFAYEPKENNLTRRVAEARALGVSYGQYMAIAQGWRCGGSAGSEIKNTPRRCRRRGVRGIWEF